MILSNKITIIGQYEGTSKFPFWKNIQCGDVLRVGMELKPTGHGYKGRIYAPDITINNETNGEEFQDTINSIQKYLGKIKFVNNFDI